VRRAAYFLLLAAYVLLASQKLSFRRSPDLGRLLRDGELISAGETAVLHENFYSYTHPADPFPNHHWLSAVLTNAVSKEIGLAGLNLVYITMGAAAFFLYFRMAERKAGLRIAAAFGAALLPLMIVRPGIRPEIFSVLSLAVFFNVLQGAYDRTLRAVWLWSLPLLELLWVNTHPGFALGPVAIGAFLGPEIITLRRTGRVQGAWSLRNLAAVLVLCILAGLANPNGLRGLLFPFTVSSNYAMEVQENLSVFQLQDTALAPILEIAVLILASVWIFAYRRRIRIEWPLLLLSAGTAALSLIFYRIYIFTGGFMLVAICANLSSLRAPKSKKDRPSEARLWWVWAAAGLSILAFVSPRWNNLGLGLDPADGELAQFLQANRITGKVFNGYGTGGYLIHYLPEQKVYIDSRPEAYPGQFVRDDYMRAIRDEAAWQRVMQTYDFDFIVFAQINQEEGQFVLRRLEDPQWAAVRAQSDVVLVRRKPAFQDVIARYPLRF